jgi:hypothetical protein
VTGTSYSESLLLIYRRRRRPLQNRKESRKRNLFFHIPIAVPLSPHLRLLENDTSLVSLQEIYEQYCHDVGMNKDDPVLTFTENLRALVRTHRQQLDINAAKLEIFEEVGTKMFPDDILKNVSEQLVLKVSRVQRLIGEQYMSRTMSTPSDLWYIRKQITLQLASVIFMTYVFSMSARNPSRLQISRATGHMYTTEMLPSASAIPPCLFGWPCLSDRRGSDNNRLQCVSSRVCQSRASAVQVHAQPAKVHHGDRHRGRLDECDHGDSTLIDRVGGMRLCLNVFLSDR